MRFLLDENVDARLKAPLAQQGHDLTRIRTDYPAGVGDEAVLSIAQHEQRILITNDRDFGELIFRLRQPHQGVILLRLGTYAPLASLILRLTDVLSRHAAELDEFLVVTHRAVRVRRSPQ